MTPTRPVARIAHRGNSYASLELDVRTTRDDRLVVLHDETILTRRVRCRHLTTRDQNKLKPTQAVPGPSVTRVDHRRRVAVRHAVNDDFAGAWACWQPQDVKASTVRHHCPLDRGTDERLTDCIALLLRRPLLYLLTATLRQSREVAL